MKQTENRLRTWGVRGCTALVVLGVLAILALAGGVDRQAAAHLPGGSGWALALRIAGAVLATAAGWLGRRRCLAPVPRQRRQAHSSRREIRAAEGRV